MNSARRQMLDAMLQKVAATRRRWKTEVVEVLPEPEEVGELCIDGSFALCAMQSNRRWLLASQAIATDEGPETPSKLARDYLMIKYGGSPRAKHAQIGALKWQQGAAPLFAAPCNFRFGWYVDIVSTYWAIMMAVGWDLDYWPNKWLSRGTPPHDFPFHSHKVARSCLVSAGMLSKTPMWSPKKGYFQLSTGNPLANLQLTRLIVDVLNCIAGPAVTAGAVYVNTDGYIVKDADALQKVVALIAEWGLTPGIKYSGAGAVYGAGVYSMAQGHKRRVKPGRIPYAKIQQRAYSGWLLENFSDYARDARAEGLYGEIEGTRSGPEISSAKVKPNGK